jgi:hypothetical protein
MFITPPGQTDILMVVMGVLLVAALLALGNIYLRLHSLPERLAHRSQKLQFEIVAILGLLALFTHIHLFWIAGLLLAFVDLPDFSTPLRSIAGSVERIADETSASTNADAAPTATQGLPPPMAEEKRPEDLDGLKKEAHSHA